MQVVSQPFSKLNNGNSIPLIGLGTCGWSLCCFAHSEESWLSMICRSFKSEGPGMDESVHAALRAVRLVWYRTWQRQQR